MNKQFYSFVPLFVGVASSVFAQRAFVPADTSKMSSYELGEVTVVASRSNARFKDIPASVSLVSSRAIVESGVKTLSAITGITPNVFMPDYGSKLTAPIYIRGVGSKINAPSVGLYVDRVPYFEKAAFAFDFFDIEQIEVLRGPQGTLYGRNTMGGIINVITKSPMSYQGTSLNLSAGTYGAYSVTAGHYAKPSKSFAYSLAASYLHNDGFYKNTYAGSMVDGLGSFGLRNRLIWNAGSKLSFENIASFERSRQGAYPYSLLDAATGTVAPIKYNEYSFYNRNLFSDAVVARYSGSGIEVLSTTAYQYLSDHQAIDQDFSELSVNFVHQLQKQNMVSQELILRSKSDTRIAWLVGAYGFAQFFDNHVNVATYAKSQNDLKWYLHDIMGFALFQQVTVKDILLKRLNLTFGLRLDAEKDVLDYRYDVVAGGATSSKEDVVYPSQKTLKLLPKVALGYSVGDVSFYGAFSTGYKTGGFNSTFERPEDLQFGPEKSKNYEVGVKSPLFSKLLYGDVALFYIDWDNQQISQSTPSGRGSMLKNAGKSRSRGVEASLLLTPIAGFDASLSYGYTDASFVRYIVNGKTDYSGNYIPYVPAHSLGIQVGKVFVLPSNSLLSSVRFGLTYRGAGKVYWTDSNSHAQSYYGVVDGRVSFIRKGVQLDLWGKNLTDNSFESFYFEMGSKKFVQMGKPLQLGVTLSLKL